MGLVKLDPRYTVSLRGFDDRGAAGALHDVTASGFRVSGVFRDPADFCVLVLYDADNFFEHPRLKHLPSFDFAGVVLQFDVRYTGLQPLPSNKFPTIAWPYLSYITENNAPGTLRLSDYASIATGAEAKASAEFVVGTPAGPAVAFDRVALFFQNFGFEYIATGGESAETVAAALAAQINGAAYGAGQALDATATGATIRVSARVAGEDGNHLGLYSQSKTATLNLTPGVQPLSGGSTDVTLRIRLDFSTLGLTQLRQLWLTFAPKLAVGAAYEATEWQAAFTNWTVTGPAQLQVAGPGSVRIEEDDPSWCAYSGNSWSVESGFYSKGFARRASAIGDRVTVRYACQSTHDLYVGTSLYTDRGRWGVSLDGGAETTLDCYLLNEPQVNTRRRVRQSVPAGEHTVTFTVRAKSAASSANYCYFDFLEAAVLSSELPEPIPARDWISPAGDYGTDHTYKNSPARIMWWMDQLGYGGALNFYVSVFWWNQRIRQGHTIPTASIDFAALGYAVGQQVFVKIADASFGKTILSTADDAATIARHFALFINSTATGVYASAAGSVLTITNRAIGSGYSFSLDAWRENADASGRVDLAHTGALAGGSPGLWMIDPGIDPVLNRGAREWLADLCRECAARGRELTLAYSMELLNPPPAWAARYPDGTAVQTATGFGTNVTTHCAFTPDVLDYQKRVFAQTAAIMVSANLPAVLQAGEYVWWYFNNFSPPTSDPGGAPGKGMAFYDAATQAAALTALGRPLALFAWPDDNPGVNGFADANFLAGLLDGYIRAIRDHVRAAYPTAEIEILLPFDVNYPRQAGTYVLGGQLNRYVNIPASFLGPATAPFDRVKMEALDWQVGTHSTDLSRETMRFPYEVGSWPKSKVRFLIGNFNGGATWERAYLDAVGEGLAGLNYWAQDHVHLFGWDVDEPIERDGVQLI